MGNARVKGSRRGGTVVTVLVLFALVVLMLAVAVPAQAASTKVKSGSTQMTVKANVVTHLQSLNVGINAVAPVTYKAQWVGAGLQWWFRAPMSSDGSVYTYSTKKGTFYHNGSLRWVEASAATHLHSRWQGLRVYANGASSYSLSAAVGDSPNVQRITVATATNTPKITKNGKAIKIDGVQFKLTAEGQASLLAAIGETISTSVILFDTDLLFNMK
jgi:hypothetical protein